MKEHTMETLKKAEDYFNRVIDMESHGSVVPSRTTEMMEACCGLEAIAIVKFKQLKKYIMSKEAHITTVSPHDSMIMEAAAAHNPHNPRYSKHG